MHASHVNPGLARSTASNLPPAPQLILFSLNLKKTPFSLRYFFQFTFCKTNEEDGQRYHLKEDSENENSVYFYELLCAQLKMLLVGLGCGRG